MEINNLTSFSFDEDKLRKIAEFVFRKEEQQGKISIVFVGLEEIKELNRIYRGKDYSTDVLSFILDERDFRGEVIISPEKVKENAGKDTDFSKEILRAMIHGILHILGYDHIRREEEKEMKEKERLYLSLVENNFLKSYNKKQ